MTTFDDRERAFEAKFAHDAELQFKVEARRNRLVGLWAAGLLGHSGEAAADYARSLIAADYAEAGHEDVVRVLVRDLEGKASETEIRATMTELLAEAKAQMATGA